MVSAASRPSLIKSFHQCAGEPCPWPSAPSWCSAVGRGARFFLWPGGLLGGGRSAA
ncbi:DUF1010 domain-containing protein [Thiohalobacter thiocyanaticus]|uniref:DUF1010 domain-containing protein n=1 Tax=Thiohalobacter thiocyanaticus TaxID=585455 RepID=A0A426QE57_9GAMM|nr:DUF1010 domain-containing protein [Thiohalobacter thiocyanaticus]